MKFKESIKLLILAAPLGACATITRGTTDMIEVTTVPSGASVTTDLGNNGTSPARIEHKRKHPYTVTVQKDGYQPQSVFVKSDWEGAGVAGFAGNVIFGGIVGMTVDTFSGATVGHKDNAHLNVTLIPLTKSATLPPRKQSSVTFGPMNPANYTMSK